MMTAHDVNAVVFSKVVRGYHTGDVDQLLDRVATQLEADANEIASLQKANEELKANMYLLAQKIEEYRADEENLKSALVNAQRMGENVIREAKQKAEGILRDASVRADGIVLDAQEENAAQVVELQRVKAEVAQFKGDVLSLYKRHIESLSTLPEEEVQQPVEEAIEEEVFAAPEFVAPTPQPEAPAPAEELAPVQAPVEEPAPLVVEAPVVAQPAAPVEEVSVSSFWEQDENALKDAAPAPAKEEAPVFQGFKGIKFSD